MFCLVVAAPATAIDWPHCHRAGVPARHTPDAARAPACRLIHKRLCLPGLHVTDMRTSAYAEAPLPLVRFRPHSASPLPLPSEVLYGWPPNYGIILFCSAPTGGDCMVILQRCLILITSLQNSDGVTSCEGIKCRWGIKISQFSTNNWLYLPNNTR